MCLYLYTQFQVSSIILTSFRQGVVLLPSSAKETHRKPTLIRGKGCFCLRNCFRAVGSFRAENSVENIYIIFLFTNFSLLHQYVLILEIIRRREEGKTVLEKVAVKNVEYRKHSKFQKGISFTISVKSI